MVQRQAVQSIEAQRMQIIAALYSNPNWDDERAERSERISELNDHFNEAIELVYYPDARKEPEIDWNNPFYAAAKRGIERTREKHRMLIGDASTMRDVVEMEEEQITARDKSRRDIDQISMAPR